MSPTAPAPWTPDRIPDQSGRTFLVTGANSGLGLASTRELLARGARVLMACRDTEKAEAARATVPEADRGRAEVLRLDLGDLRDVRRVVAGFTSGERGPVDVLVGNAGVMNIPFARTPQGHEMQFGVNALGHFALATGLEPVLTDRVVWLGSLAHRVGEIHLDDLDWRHRRYRAMRAYGQSKLACMMLAFEQQRRFVRTGSPLRAMAAHPGYAATTLQRHSGRPVLDRVMALGNTVPGLSQPPELGALCELYAATVPDLPGGAYVGPSGPFELTGAPRPVGSSARSHDADVAAELWRRCAAMVAEAGGPQVR